MGFPAFRPHAWGAKTQEWNAVRALRPRPRKGKPLKGRRKLRRGSTARSGCNDPAAARTHCWSKALKATKGSEALFSAMEQVLQSAPSCLRGSCSGGTPRGYFPGDEPEEPGSEGNSLKSETPRALPA